MLLVSFRVKHEGGYYMAYVSTGSMKSFECGDVRQKWLTCPHKSTDKQVNLTAAATEALGAGDALRASEGASTPSQWLWELVMLFEF